jgi:hypothetical protein
MTDRHKVFNELMKSAQTSNAITALDAAIKAAEKSAVSSIGSEQPVSTGQVKGSNPLRQATPPAQPASESANEKN